MNLNPCELFQSFLSIFEAMRGALNQHDVFDKGFAENIVRKIDPQMRISKDAEILIGKMALDFAEKVSLCASELAELRGSEEIESVDIKDAVKSQCGIEMPGGSSDPIPRAPNREYQEMVLAATAQDDAD